MTAERGELPSRHELEHWCSQLAKELGWWWDGKYSPPYRWATSGLDGVKGQNFDPRGRDRHTDLVGETATIIDKGSPLYKTFKAQRAAWKLKDALDLLNSARSDLESLERTKRPPQGPVASMWQGTKEMDRLHKNQDVRKANGTAWGDG